jgi:tryptophan halogenase
MTGTVNRVLIVGGGTAGWLAAAHLSRKLGAARGGVQITLIESSDIGIVGVGEGTFPSIKKTIIGLGVPEPEFMKACSAAYKQGFKFVNWRRSPGTGGPDSYYHPFNLPEATRSGIDLLPYWLMGVGGDRPLSEAICVQGEACSAGRGPKRVDQLAFYGSLNYAYHFDAGKMATWLAGVGVANGVKRLIGTVDGVNLAEDGAIASVSTKEHGVLTADLFIDCTGFRGELIGKALGSPYHDVDDQLFVNRAWAMQVPYQREDEPIASHTIATAHEAGWTWDIGLHDRRGVGYVFSSHHSEDDRAEAVLRGYLGAAGEGLDARLIKFRLGYRHRPWVKNCVGVGLACGFLEPLESTGIAMIDVAVEMLGEIFPHSAETMEQAAGVFNKVMTTRFELAVDFLKLHYGLSKRTDCGFWTDNADPRSFSDRLTHLLEVWGTRPPSTYDFTSTLDSFPSASYKYVLYGMGFKTDMTGQEAVYPHRELAEREMQRVSALAKEVAGNLPAHRDLLDGLYATV